MLEKAQEPGAEEVTAAWEALEMALEVLFGGDQNCDNCNQCRYHESYHYCDNNHC